MDDLPYTGKKGRQFKVLSLYENIVQFEKYFVETWVTCNGTKKYSLESYTV